MSDHYLEAYAVAVNGDRSLDIVGAAGMVRNRLGVALARAVGEMDGGGLSRSALLEARRHAHILAVRHDIPLAVADTALAQFLRPVCEACDGVGYLKIPGTPKLSDAACPCCEGTGKAPIRGGEQGRRFHGWLEDFYRRAGQRIKSNLG